MHLFINHACTICGREKTRDGWFLIAVNRWEDKLKILEWNARCAFMDGVEEVCSAAHAMELVMHWMRTDSLSYPFARKQPSSANRGPTSRNDPDTIEARQLGELYVHRESIGRLLKENPDSLTVILEEFALALQPGRKIVQQKETAEDNVRLRSSKSQSAKSRALL
ncbi:MAG: hypothetical protein ACRD2U_06555 [Terriglobales bacterium]